MQKFKLKQKPQFNIVSNKENVITLENLNNNNKIILMKSHFDSIFQVNGEVIEYKPENEPTYQVFKTFYDFKKHEDRYLILINNIGSCLKVSKHNFDDNYYISD
tara:strand:- start:8144 stop:8455 length:312 start_codon:yes stop_codon:yes gene_type:complete